LNSTQVHNERNSVYGSTRATTSDYIKLRIYRASPTITPIEVYSVHVFTDVPSVYYYTTQLTNLDNTDGRPLNKVTNASRKVRVEL
jgi:hypothetical protein